MEQVTNDALNTELSTWLSTYGLLTANSILQRFNFKVNSDELRKSLSDPLNLYSVFLKLPFKNVFNGIISEQANDYRGYAQKLFIDYLLSGAAVVNEELPGANIRESLEVESENLRVMSEGYEKVVYAHEQCIASSQNVLLSLAKKVVTIEVVEQAIAVYLEQAEKLMQQFAEYRGNFYNLILRSQELIQLLPDYRQNAEKIAKNQEALLFESIA